MRNEPAWRGRFRRGQASHLDAGFFQSAPTGIAVDARLFFFYGPIMRGLVIFEDAGYRNLLPLVYWRTVSELRTGYGRLCDHVAHTTSTDLDHLSIYCRPEMADVTAERFDRPVNAVPDHDEVLLVNGRWLGTAVPESVPPPAVQWLDGEPVFISADRALCDRLTPKALVDPAATQQALADVPTRSFVDHPRLVRYPWDLVHANDEMLRLGWERAGRPAAVEGRVCDGVHLLEPSAIRIGHDALIKPGVVLDAEKGPILIDDGATVCPNVTIEGPCFIGPESLVQPGSVLRDGMSVGPRCKVGGELEASIIHGFSNKQHDGFLGHAYVGEWVNMGADTVNSDLKNTYGTIRVPINGVEIDSGQMFVGLTIGDHSKTGIGQMIPTGGVVGFASMVATGGFAPKFVPSFAWLTQRGMGRQQVDQALAVAHRMMSRRDRKMTPAQEALFLATPDRAAAIERCDPPR